MCRVERIQQPHCQAHPNARVLAVHRAQPARPVRRCQVQVQPRHRRFHKLPQERRCVYVIGLSRGQALKQVRHFAFLQLLQEVRVHWEGPGTLAALLACLYNGRRKLRSVREHPHVARRQRGHHGARKGCEVQQHPGRRGLAHGIAGVVQCGYYCGATGQGQGICEQHAPLCVRMHYLYRRASDSRDDLVGAECIRVNIVLRQSQPHFRRRIGARVS
mmetsp:Transcript_30551/g.67523  ORF Transcript_30551/g.67523 Transcript_30551/m.67523 type:complete len:217 (-) Transcript_30551:157-807(-)